MCQWPVDRIWKRLCQQTLEQAPMTRADQSSQQSSQVSIDAELFVAVVASGKPSQVHFDAQLSDPDPIVIR